MYMQYFKNTFQLPLYATIQQKFFEVRLLVVTFQVNCAAISAMLQSSTLVKSYNSSEERIINAYLHFLSCTMKPVYSCTMFVWFRELKANENYNYKLREKHQTSKKRNDNLRLCPYNVNDHGIWAIRANSPQETNSRNTSSVEHMVFTNLAKHLG